jgi:hypothetical protein
VIPAPHRLSLGFMECNLHRIYLALVFLPGYKLNPDVA